MVFRKWKRFLKLPYLKVGMRPEFVQRGTRVEKRGLGLWKHDHDVNNVPRNFIQVRKDRFLKIIQLYFVNKHN